MGRPAFKPTDEQREQVLGFVKSKISIEEMARRMELAEKTFRKHFAQELGIIPVETINTGMALARLPTSALRPTDEQREMALILAGARLSHPEIARKLGITVEALQEHFADELERGPIKCKADILVSMYHAGKGGNVAAGKVFLLFNGQAEESPQQQPAPVGLQGKKEIAAIGAKTASVGTSWESDVGGGGKLN